ncbi:unnamed protein product [Ostreobium quekettii]|uniref:Protein kinase domain-containing protein n=1 Tax=Ostreobium quekettii TaxID=121088 RepID=A0A8S1J1U8_9CHLO|nr:unnamed protein product [Ostreobium quekettii]
MVRGSNAWEKAKVGATIENLVSLINEATGQASLRHNHIVSIHDVTIDGWLVMELANRGSQTVCGERSLAWCHKVELLLQAATGVNHMHSQVPPLIYCDLKPKNILVFNSGLQGFCVEVNDVGQTFHVTKSKSKTIRKRRGTLQYIAPESYHGKFLTPESDVFSFGAAMYQVVSGLQPYEQNMDAFRNAPLCRGNVR